MVHGYHWRWRGWCLAGLLVLSAIGAGGATTAITLREYLGVGWTNETVSYPVSFPAGTCVTNSLRLSGPAGAVPVQLHDAGYWPATAFVSTGRLSFVVATLGPLATNTYTLTYDSVPSGQPEPDSGLAVDESSGELLALCRVATNWPHRPGVLLRTGSAVYEPHIAATAAPAPIVEFRNVDGMRFGGSRLYGNTPVAAFAATVLDRGPVFVRVRYRYEYADGAVLGITVRLDAREGAWSVAGESFRVTFDTEVTGSATNDGWDLLLSGLPAPALQFLPEAAGAQSGTYTVSGYKAKAIADYAAGLVTKLTPWGDWWDEFTQPLFYLQYLGTNSANRLLEVRRTQPDAWIAAGPPGVAQPWEWFTQKQVPLSKDADGALYLRVSNAGGARHWLMAEETFERRMPVIGAQNAMPGEYMWPLDDVKELSLEWTGSATNHPRLFLSAAELAQAGVEQPAALAELTSAANLRSGLGQFAYFDTMRKPETYIYQYDALIDDPAYITPAEKACLRARMAFMTYRLAGSANWCDERGYRSYNENMSIAQALNVGLAACAIPDHPQAAAWIDYARMRLDTWLSRLDAAGYWNESSHYARVSLSKLIFFALALRKAGVHDYFADATFRAMGELYERTLTPPDPLVAAGRRLSAPYGRGSHSSNWGFGGLFARATATSDPAYSRLMQWSYVGTGYGTIMATPNPAGYPLLYPRRDLAATQPDWRSELVPSVGPLLRSGVGTAGENYLWLIVKNPTNPDGEWWPSETGAVISWFARGVPLSRRFGSSPDGNDHGLLMNRVMPAANWSPGVNLPAGFESVNTCEPPVFLGHTDYVNATFLLQTPWTRIQTMPSTTPAFPVVAAAGGLPLAWRRQLLWVHDAVMPTGTQYLVFRDTVGGGQPSQWQFWTLSTRVDPPGVPDGGRGNAAREITGNRFTAYGQFNVDVEYFVAAPTDTPRYTLRDVTRGHGYGVNGGNYYAINQDLFHLRRSGDGSYYVALFPRDRNETAPTFTAPGAGRIIRIAGGFGTDYVMLAETNASAALDPVTLTGTAAAAQVRTGGTTLTLAAAGAVTCGDYGLESTNAAVLAVSTDGTLSLQWPAGNGGGEAYIRGPAHYGPAAGPGGVTVTPAGASRYRVAYPAGTTTLRLRTVPAPGTVLCVMGKRKTT